MKHEVGCSAEMTKDDIFMTTLIRGRQAGGVSDDRHVQASKMIRPTGPFVPGGYLNGIKTGRYNDVGFPGVVQVLLKESGCIREHAADRVSVRQR